MKNLQRMTLRKNINIIFPNNSLLSYMKTILFNGCSMVTGDAFLW